MCFKNNLSDCRKDGIYFFPQNVSKEPKVSISIVTYQHINFLKQCLEGVLNQKTDFSYEILLAEDNSKDGTKELCIEYAKEYPDKIRLILHDRRNNITINNSETGRFSFIYNIEISNGKFIALCEGDDYWTDPLKLQKQIDFLDSHPECSFCFHKAQVREESQGSIIKEFPENLTHHQVLNTKEYLGISSTATSSLVFKKTNIKALYELFHSHGDFLLYCELLQKGKGGYIDDRMSVYRKHSNGISFNYVTPGYLRNRIKELKKEKRYFSDNEVKREISRIHKEHILRYISLYGDTLSINEKSFFLLDLLKSSSFYKDMYIKCLKITGLKYN